MRKINKKSNKLMDDDEDFHFEVYLPYLPHQIPLAVYQTNSGGPYKNEKQKKES